MKRILMVLTSHGELDNTDSKTGVWLGEFTDPYYMLSDEGYEITLASPAGGEPPVDPMSKLTENITASNRRFNDDKEAQAAFASTMKLDAVDPAGYDAVFFPGGHGPLWDLATDEACARIVLDFYRAGKPIAAVCHGPAALIKAAELEPGLLQGKRLTAFTNTEEAMVMKMDNIPYKLEDKLMELGADFRSALIPMAVNVEVDGWLITGQNPASASRTAKALVERLRETA
ncbi:Putative intracellular protease/amidase [Parapedobacter composti]|uniref:Putative intracellular protease/amidase n=1 Tax=Parapedobacter composti TaxID=623281 RepID=A0A1I1JA16_9SPHI|nr:type 1 glutamine amidotransferase domain-containing protein [Parapedobacter composti]SFC45427.1 Putative intracellular protease/amidase [Parapedobacter composti]